jgi:hypothetical protein
MKKKFDIRKIKIRKVKVDEIDDRMLLINLYATQVLTLIIGIIWLLFQHQNLLAVMAPPRSLDAVWWGLGLAAAVVAIDLLISRWYP